MRQFAFVLPTLVLASASAAPLVGSTSSFMQTDFCKKYACTVDSSVMRTANLRDFTYWLKSSYPDDAPWQQATMLRQDGKIISMGYRIGVQDGPFVAGYPDYTTNQAAEYIALATGKKPSAEWLQKLQCGHPLKEGSVKTSFQGASRKYTVDCATYEGRSNLGQVVGFWWVEFNIY